MWRVVNEKYILSELVERDNGALVEHLQEKEIYDNTLRIPYPYSVKDADSFIQMCTAADRAAGRTQTWAIREASSTRLIGCVGLLDPLVAGAHQSQLGYWLAKPFWGQGLMTEVVRTVCKVAFEEYELVRVSAHVFLTNPRSGRVLEKAGFELEGTMKCFYCKNDELFDGKLYARLADWARKAHAAEAPVQAPGASSSKPA